MKKWHWIVLMVVLVVVGDWLSHRPDTRSRELNNLISEQGSVQMKAYPYQFRVLRVDNGVVYMTTLRNRDVPALKAIAALNPGMNVMDHNDPAFIKAEKEMATVQGEASKIVQSQPDIKSVRWELDRKWLYAHGIEVPDDK